ncbi:MAG: MraY family glycosyltransferase [Planctomycetota bacterium]|jgi:UDP-GlcNAc:undecaprenyl-phosphate GlcNAc-1-phosphate transferase
MELFSGGIAPFTFTALAFGCSVVSALLVTALAAPAERWGLVSRHRRDRFSSRRVPLTGGPALFGGCVAALLVLRAPLPLGWIVAIAGFFLVGLVDDLVELRPAKKFVAQAVVGLAVAWLLAPSPGYIALWFLVFGLLVNVSNYLDNMDGLLAGVALTQALALALLGPVAGPGSVLLLWALPGVALFTLPPARAFLGDSGSHLIGALLAIDALELLRAPDGVRVGLLLPLALILVVPLADAATVTVSRLRRKRPVFRGGTDHLSHRLVRLGFPVPRAVLVLVLASAVCGLSAVLLARF